MRFSDGTPQKCQLGLGSTFTRLAWKPLFLRWTKIPKCTRTRSTNLLQNLELNDKPASHSEQMWAIIKSKPEKGLWMGSLNIPQPGPDVVLIKVTKVSICGTDKHIYDWDNWASSNIALPLILGHEFVGTVLKVGELHAKVRKWRAELGKCRAGSGYVWICRQNRHGILHHQRTFMYNHRESRSKHISCALSNVIPQGWVRRHRSDPR